MVASRVMLCKKIAQTFILSVLVLAMGISGVPARAYDAPRFDRVEFERDGVSLSDSEMSKTIEALVRILKEGTLDEDLKEKAVGVGLRLNPRDEKLRKAHATLSGGATPGLSADDANLKTAMNMLWDQGLELLKARPTPDDAQLGKYLIELAVVANPAPTADQIKKLADITDYGSQNWERFVTTQPENISNQRLKELYADLQKREKRMESKSSEVVVSPPTTPSVEPVTTPPAMDEDVPVSELKLLSASLPCILSSDSPWPEAGIVKLEVRDPSTDEESLFSLFTPDGARRDSFEMRLVPVSEGFQIEGLKVVETQIRRSYPKWPAKKIVELSIINADGTAFAPRRLSEVDLTIPGVLLMESAFSGRPIPDDIVVMAINKGRRLEGVGMPVLGFDRANAFEKPKIISSNKIYPFLLSQAQKQDNISSFARSSILGVEDMDQLLKVVFDSSAKSITDAVSAYDAVIAKKTETQSFEDFSRLPATTAALKPIVENYPFHLSARALMEFGSEPVPPEILNEKAITQIDAVIQPFGDRYKEAASSDGGGVIEDLGDEFSDARAELRKIVTSIPEAVVPYLRQAENVLDPMEEYLGLRNKTTATGRQKHESLINELRELMTIRESLGFPLQPQNDNARRRPVGKGFGPKGPMRRDRDE